MSNIHNHEERLQNLEVSLTHQDQQIQDMSDMITAQWKEIDTLKLLLKRAESRLQEYLDSTVEQDKPQSPTEFAAQNKPPHY